MPTAPNPGSPSLCDSSSVPDTSENILALIIVIRVERDLLLTLTRPSVFISLTRAATRLVRATAHLPPPAHRRAGGRGRRVEVAPRLLLPLSPARKRVLPAPVQHHPLRLQYELADLVLLRLLPRVDVLPADLDAARRAGDVGDDVRARHQGAGLGAPDGEPSMAVQSNLPFLLPPSSLLHKQKAIPS